MNRDTWETIKRSKNFNVNIYRRGLTVLIFFLVLSCTFGMMMFYIYLTEPERDFYATSGISPPIKLQPLLSPNFSGNALLPPDPEATEVENKLIPE